MSVMANQRLPQESAIPMVIKEHRSCWIIMGNDYPFDEVFTDEDKANKKLAELRKGRYYRVYWRTVLAKLIPDGVRNET